MYPKDRAVRLFDLTKLLGGVPESGSKLDWDTSKMSKFEKIYPLIQNHFPMVLFSLQDVKSVYEQELEDSINLSTVSTFYSRMVNRETLLMKGTRKHKRFGL